MARQNSFSIKINVEPLSEFAENLRGLGPDEIGQMLTGAINEVADSTYDLSRRTILSGINLTDSYVERKMTVQHATPSKPSASIVAFGGKEFTTSLSHYGAIQLDRDVNWSNERILAEGHKFGKWPGWTRRVGSAALGIEADRKAAGRSVEVVKSRRKKIGPAFAIPGKKDNDGNLLVFTRKDDGKLKSLSGPSVYQLFAVAAKKIEDSVYGNLGQALIDAAERSLNRELGK